MSGLGKEKQKSVQGICTFMALEFASSYLHSFFSFVVHPGSLYSLMIEL